MEREYGHQSYGRGMDNATERFGPYESFDSRSSVGGRDLYRSGYGYNESEQGYGDSYDGRYETQYRNSVDSYDGRDQGGSSWDPSFTRAKVRTEFMEDRGRDTYSSYGAYSSPYMKPATVGSRGRGMPAYTDGAFGGRSNDAFGGPAAGRGRGRGRGRRQFGRGMRRPEMFDFEQQSMSGRMGRGIKRKMGEPSRQPFGFRKKPKLTQAGGKQGVKNTPAPERVVSKEEEQLRTEARREKQRRRREKNSEKYGDGKVFTCSFCKFRSFDEKGIEEHLESPDHQEMLDHIQKQTKFDKSVMEFLHECIVNKYKKTSARKVQSVQNEATKALAKDIMEGVTPDDHMLKVETVRCSLCSVSVSALQSSVQVHLASDDHSKKKLGYKDQIKRDSILTATSILNNPLVKARYELYLKGENPFETKAEAAEDVTEAATVGDEAAATDAADFVSDFTEDPLASTE